MKKRYIIISLVVLLLVSGCTSAPKTTAPGDTTGLPVKTAPPQDEAVVTLPLTENVVSEDFLFYPAEVVIAKGGTVTWRQKDYEKHTVTGAGFDSGELSYDQKFSHKFDEPGVYEYRCKLHPSMKGKIIVK